VPARPWSAAANGLTVTVRLTPKGGRDAIETLADGNTVLKVRVRAAPHGGAANQALCRVLAKALGVPPSRVEITGGATSRIKRVKIVGDAAALAAALTQVSSGAERSEEPGIHNHRQCQKRSIVVMDSGPRFARPE
jgi:uncharacterized protein